MKTRSLFDHVLICGHNGAIYQLMAIPLPFHRVLLALQEALFGELCGMMDLSHCERIAEFDHCGNVVDVDVLEECLDLDPEILESVLKRTPSLQTLSVHEIEQLLSHLRKLLTRRN